MEIKSERPPILDDTELPIEELEPIAAPISWPGPNHNETVLSAEAIALDIEELEEIVAPGLRMNHDETFVSDPDLQLELEELEPVIAPIFWPGPNHNETLVRESQPGLN
jgi:hypothetical protein